MVSGLTVFLIYKISAIFYVILLLFGFPKNNVHGGKLKNIMIMVTCLTQAWQWVMLTGRLRPSGTVKAVREQ